MEAGCEYLGAVRIKDGLFLGDALSAWDVDFLTSNGVEYIVNCTTSDFDYSAENVNVLKLDWAEDEDVEVINTPQVRELVHFIDQADQEGVSCLIHSRRGQSRAVLAICLHLMIRYFWTAQKALEFVLSRRPDLQLRRQYIIQLLRQEKALRNQFSLSSDWDVSPILPDEEILLRNTFKNCLQSPLEELTMKRHKQIRPGNKSVSWKLDFGACSDMRSGIESSTHSMEQLGKDGTAEEEEEEETLFISGPDHPPSTPREKAEASAHWSIPSRPNPDTLVKKKTSEALTVEIPLTVHPALRASQQSIKATSPSRLAKHTFNFFKE